MGPVRLRRRRGRGRPGGLAALVLLRDVECGQSCAALRNPGRQPVGGYLIGLAVGFFETHAGLPPEWRLFAITGFLGRLTTFSTFSSEVVGNLMAGDFGWALLHLLAHLGGSLLLTAAGLWTYRLLS